MSARSVRAISRETRRSVSVGSSVELSARLTASRVSVSLQPQMLALQQIRPLGLGALAVGDVAQDGQVTAGDESRRGVVLDGTALTVGTDEAQLADLLAVLQEGPPRGIQVHAGLVEEVVELAADQLVQRQTEEAAGGGVGVDELARIVDDQHGVSGRREERLGRIMPHHADSLAVVVAALRLVSGWAAPFSARWRSAPRRRRSRPWRSLVGPEPSRRPPSPAAAHRASGARCLSSRRWSATR